MEKSLKNKVRKLLQNQNGETEAVILICNELDMHGEDATSLLNDFIRENYDENGLWIGDEN